MFENYIKDFTNFYILTTLTLFVSTIYPLLATSSNYMSATMLFFQQTQNQLLFYNAIICTCLLMLRIIVWVFFSQISSEQFLEILTKIQWAAFWMGLYYYLLDKEMTVFVFIGFVMLLMALCLHHLASIRTKQLISSPSHPLPPSTRLIPFLLLLLFLHLPFLPFPSSSSWISSLLSSSPKTIIYYHLQQISMNLLQIMGCFMVHYYEMYTHHIIHNVDIYMGIVKVTVLLARVLLNINIMMNGLSVEIYGSLEANITLNYIVFSISRTIYKLFKASIKLYHTCSLAYKLSTALTPTLEQLSKITDPTCTITPNNLQSTRESIILPCSHIFHRQCIRQWITRSGTTCPKCKGLFNLQNLNVSNKNSHQRQQAIHQYETNLTSAQPHLQIIEPQPQHILKIANNYVVKLPPNTHNNVYFQKDKIGSVPFGLPTEAICNRKERHLIKRAKVIGVNTKLVKLFTMEPAKQLLFLAQVEDVQ